MGHNKNYSGTSYEHVIQHFSYTSKEYAKAIENQVPYQAIENQLELEESDAAKV